MTAIKYLEKNKVLYSFSEEENIESAMKEYAKEKCAEQRKLCEENSDMGGLHDPDYDVLSKSILEAPEPTYD